VISQSDMQYEKHFSQRISTRRGIVIRDNDENENADRPIDDNCEFASNEISNGV
jgi:hypothetical protein